MGLAQDLLEQAKHLASYEGNNPTQASLRRAVSTSYYALFHLLLEDASQRWQGSAEARHGLAPCGKYRRKFGAWRVRS